MQGDKNPFSYRILTCKRCSTITNKEIHEAFSHILSHTTIDEFEDSF